MLSRYKDKKILKEGKFFKLLQDVYSMHMHITQCIAYAHTCTYITLHCTVYNYNSTTTIDIITTYVTCMYIHKLHNTVRIAVWNNIVVFFSSAVLTRR